MTYQEHKAMLAALEAGTATPDQQRAAHAHLLAIDGSTKTFERDHPDAGDMFAAEHGDVDTLAAGEDHEGEDEQLQGEGPGDDLDDDGSGHADIEDDEDASSDLEDRLDNALRAADAEASGRA